MAAPIFIAATKPTSTPSANWDATNQSATRTTASFSVTAGDILVCLASAEDGDRSFAGTPAVSGGGLTWTKQEEVATTGASCRAGIWTATAAATTSITVSMTTDSTSIGTRFWGFVVHQYQGSDGIGAHASQNNAVSGVAPSLALTTNGDKSAISYLDGDWTATDGTTRTWRTINGITPTAGNGLETDYFRDSGGTHYTVYAGYWSDVGAAGSKTTGISTPTQRPTIVAIEIKGAGFDPSYVDWPLRQPHPKMRGAA
jgi:hypothetical protein